jgi:transcriptional regulator with XRE-family HTH domain
MKSQAHFQGAVTFNFEVVKAMRKARGLTVARFAHDIGLRSQGHLSNIENGDRQPSWATVQRFAKELGLSPASLVLAPEPVNADNWPHNQGRRTDRMEEAAA